MNIGLIRYPLGSQLPAGSPTASVSLPFNSTSTPPRPTDGSCGKCGIEAPGGIRLVYWEPDNAVKNGSNITLAQNSSQAYTQVDYGFTYTSPSVYVIYSSLRATVRCADSALYTIGPSFSQKTIAYSSRFLAYGTLSIPDAGCSEHVVVDGFHTIDFSSLYYNPITTTTTYKAGCAPYVNPRLSLPAELTSVDPSWRSCEPLFYGAFDPPSIITKASGGLVPSPVGAGQVTDPASPQAIPEGVSAHPVVTPAPPVAAPTNDASNTNVPPPANPLPESPVPVVSNPAPATTGNPAAASSSAAIPNSPAASVPASAANVENAPANQSPGQQGVGKPSIPGQSSVTPISIGNSNPMKANAPPKEQAASPASSPQSLGDLINSPSVGSTGNEAANPAAGSNPATVIANPNKPVVSPALVAVPVDTSDGKPAYAVVAAEAPTSGGNTGLVAAVPLAGAPAGQHSAPANDQSALDRENPATAPGEYSDNNDTAAAGQSASTRIANVPGSGSDNGPAGTTKVILNDGRTANIPTADIIELGQPQGGSAAAGVSPSKFQTVHLTAGAFIAVPGASSSSSSVAVQGGDYLIPKPTADVPQQTFTLQGGRVTTVPVDLPRPITLQDGQATKIPGNAPPLAVTLQNGQIATISPIPHATVTLANGQVTAVPSVGSIAGSGGDGVDMPQQILTLRGGKVTAVPIDMPARTATLQDGKVTAIPADAPTQVVTLADGKVSTISAVPHTTVTLVNGKVTSIPVSNTGLSSQNTGFIDVPYATISGKVHYTHLPIIKVQNVALNNTRNGTNASAGQSELSISASATGTANLVSSDSVQAAVSTPSGSITMTGTGATAGKTSSGSRLRSKSKLFFGLVTLALVCWTDVT